MSAALQRYAAAGEQPVAPHEAGNLVLFADIEPALKDQTRFQWILPLIDGSDNEHSEARSFALFNCHQEGFRGLALVDEAMRRCPT